MPTKAECRELIGNTTHAWVTVSPWRGRKFASKTDSVIRVFFPAASQRSNGAQLAPGATVYVWTSTFVSDRHVIYLDSVSNGISVTTGDRKNAKSVRGVLPK